MAGENPDDPNFAADFREGIRFAMTMGLPPVEADQPTFIFSQDATFVPAARDGAPWDWTQAPTSVDPDPAKEPVLVPCAVEVSGQGTDITSVGTFDFSRAVLTFLDEDWALVFGFHRVLLGGDPYLYVRQLPPLGMFDVQVHQVLVEAMDET